MDRILEEQLEPMYSYLVNNLPYNTLIRCYESSPVFRSLAKEILAAVSSWEFILSYFEVPVVLLEDLQDILPWDVVFTNQNLSRETIERFKHHIKWEETSVYVNTPLGILKHFVDEPNFSWSHFCKYVELPVEYIEENAERVNWKKICYYQVLNEEFLSKNVHKLHWKSVSIRQRLSEKFIADHADRLDWLKLCRHQVISDNLLRKYAEKIDWSAIICTQSISDGLMEEFKDQLDWNLLMSMQRLSELQFLKYEDKVNWNKVAYNGDLSFDFIKGNLHRLVWDHVIMYQCLPYDFIEDHIDYFNWNIVSRNDRLPLKFIQKYLVNLDLLPLLLINRSFPVAFIENVLLKDPRFKNHEDTPELWLAISHYDSYPEEFIHKYREELNWEILCKHQTFRENFIADHHEYVYWPSICSRQKLSPSFLLSFKDYICWPIVLVKPHISQGFIQYVTDNYVDLGTVLEYYNSLKAFKKLHRMHCLSIDNHHTGPLSFLQIGDQLEYFDSNEKESNMVFVWYLKMMSTHSYEGPLCTSFKLCIGCSSRNCKESFCVNFDIFVEAYISHTYNKLVKGYGMDFVWFS